MAITKQELIEWEHSKWHQVDEIPLPADKGLNYSKPLIFSNGMVGYFSYESNQYIAKPSSIFKIQTSIGNVKVLKEQGIKWSYWPCASEPETVVQMIFDRFLNEE